MKRNGWLISDIIISISLIFLFILPLMNIYKSINYHMKQEEKKQLSIQFLENSIEQILASKYIDLPIRITDEKYEIIVTEIDKDHENISKLNVDINEYNGDYIHSFTLYKEVDNEK